MIKLPHGDERIRGFWDGRKIIILKEENPYWRVFYGMGYGENFDDRLELDPIEALHLLDTKKIIIVDENGETVDQKKLINSIEEIKWGWPTYIIYKDLRQRGYPIKLINDYPLVIDIYPRGSSILDSDPEYSIFPVEALKEIDLRELDEAIDKCRKKGTQLVVGIVDEVGDVTYYKVLEVLEAETTFKVYPKKKI